VRSLRRGRSRVVHQPEFDCDRPAGAVENSREHDQSMLHIEVAMPVLRLAVCCAVLVSWLTTPGGGPALADEPLKLPDVKPFDLGEGRKLGKGPSREHSGIVKSRNWPDLYWMQNDSGDEPRIYPVRRDGSVYFSERDSENPGVLIGGAVNVD
jgi:hypothetical protein